MTIEDPVEYTLPVDQPDPDQRAGRHHLRQRSALDPAPRPRHHPGRRGPRRRHRAHRRAVRADRALRPVVAARDRLDRRAVPPARHGHRDVPRRLECGSGRRAAPGATQLHALPGAVHPDAEELAFFAASGGTLKTDFCAGTGCNFCSRTGYLERIGVYELLPITPEIKRLVVGWATHDEIRRLAVSQGMRTLQDEALRLVETDVTTISEVVRAIYAF